MKTIKDKHVIYAKMVFSNVTERITLQERTAKKMSEERGDDTEDIIIKNTDKKHKSDSYLNP